MRYLRPIALALLLLGACACDKPTPAAANAATLAPSDPKLARLYAQTCKACHAAPGSGAPLAGDTAAWAPWLVQGEKARELGVGGRQRRGIGRGGRGLVAGAGAEQQQGERNRA